MFEFIESVDCNNSSNGEVINRFRCLRFENLKWIYLFFFQKQQTCFPDRQNKRCLVLIHRITVQSRSLSLVCSLSHRQHGEIVFFFFFFFQRLLGNMASIEPLGLFHSHLPSM